MKVLEAGGRKGFREEEMRRRRKKKKNQVLIKKGLCNPIPSQ